MFPSKTLTALAGATLASAISVSVTPHDNFSSSAGFLGCYLNTNRVAYWPDAVGCDNLCVKVTYQSRSVTLLRVDQSGGAHDISYDAWNYLNVGASASTNPTMGGGLTADYTEVPMEQCADLIKTPSGKLAITAANGMNYVTSCTASDTYVGKHFELRNINTPTCTYGNDEVCTMPDPSVSNQPSCPHTLGMPSVLTSKKVVNLAYGTGKETTAL